MQRNSSAATLRTGVLLPYEFPGCVRANRTVNSRHRTMRGIVVKFLEFRMAKRRRRENSAICRFFAIRHTAQADSAPPIWTGYILLCEISALSEHRAMANGSRRPTCRNKPWETRRRRAVPALLLRKDQPPGWRFPEAHNPTSGGRHPAAPLRDGIPLEDRIEAIYLCPDFVGDSPAYAALTAPLRARFLTYRARNSDAAISRRATV